MTGIFLTMYITGSWELTEIRHLKMELNREMHLSWEYYEYSLLSLDRSDILRIRDLAYLN
jgi:hypothetical protein